MPHSDWVDRFPVPPPLHVPATLSAWGRNRAKLRTRLLQVLNMPERARRPRVRILSHERRQDYSLERFSFENGVGDTVPGYMLLPANGTNRVPAILYCHWHGGEYELGKEELFQDLHMPDAPGPALARRGYAVICIDAPGFGERNGSGPGGPEDKGNAGEVSAAKYYLWAGTSLWSMILRDDLLALEYLASRPEIDPRRIGIMGMSMGATRAWWLMALDERIKAGAAVCCLTRYRDLVAARGLRQHGIYYYVPGLAAEFEAEHIVSLIAPRRLLLLNGDRDPTSPVAGIRAVTTRVAPVYRLYRQSSAFRSIIYPQQGHVFTPVMWQETLGWFGRHI